MLAGARRKGTPGGVAGDGARRRCRWRRVGRRRPAEWPSSAVGWPAGGARRVGGAAGLGARSGRRSAGGSPQGRRGWARCPGGRRWPGPAVLAAAARAGGARGGGLGNLGPRRLREPRRVGQACRPAPGRSRRRPAERRRLRGGADPLRPRRSCCPWRGRDGDETEPGVAGRCGARATCRRSRARRRRRRLDGGLRTGYVGVDT